MPKSRQAQAGVVTFTDLGAANSAAVTEAQIAFEAAGLQTVLSSAVTLPWPRSRLRSSERRQERRLARRIRPGGFKAGIATGRDGGAGVFGKMRNHLY